MGRHRVKPKKTRPIRNLVVQNAELTPWENLAMAIVQLAVNDAKVLTTRGVSYARSDKQIIIKWELINFFCSRWCAVLLGFTEIEGKVIAERIGLYGIKE